MPWTMKAGAPAYAYALEEVRALVTGTADAWLTDWLWLLGGTPVAVAPLCAAGPRECDSFTPDDFLSAATSGNRAGVAINLLQLVPKLQCFVEQRLFGAYCESVTVGGGAATWHWYTHSACGTGPTGWDMVIWAGQTPLPRWATSLYFNVLSGGNGSLALSVSNDAPYVVGQTWEANRTTIVASGYGDRDRAVGSGAEQPIGSYQNGTRDLYPMIVRRGDPSDGGATYCVDLQYYGADPGGTTEYDPPPVYRPPTAIAPEPGNYPDIAALGTELDFIERKLEILLDDAASRQVATLWPLVPVGGPFAVTNDTDISIPEGGGLVVAATNIGNQTDETYGEPRRLHRLGRVTVGGPSGWLPPFDITVSPMMLVGLPLEVTRARVHVMPPAVATVQVLQRAQPVG